MLPRTTFPLFYYMCVNSHILSLFTSPRLSVDFRLFFFCYQDGSNALARFLHPGWKQKSYQTEAYLIMFHVNVYSGLRAMASVWVLFLDEFTIKGNRTELLRLAFSVCDSTNSERKKNMPASEEFYGDCLGFLVSNSLANPIPISFLVSRRFQDQCIACEYLASLYYIPFSSGHDEFITLPIMPIKNQIFFCLF